MRYAPAMLACLLAQAQAADVVEVRIRDYRFVPDRVVVRVGGTVKWINDEKRASHALLFPQEKLQSERLMSGESWQLTFERPGSYAYACEPHPEMRGHVQVVP